MKIQFKPTLTMMDVDYFKTYVFPLGQPRARSELIPQKGAIIYMNAPECISIVRVCLLVASEYGGVWDFTILSEGSPGCWVGDLEPGSIEFAMVREGSPDSRNNPYILDVPENPSPLIVNWLAGSRIKIVQKYDYFDIIGTAPAFVSLAHHFASLASNIYPSGTRICYEPGRDLVPDSLPLVIEKVDFPMDVPWARPPPSKKQ